MNRRTLQLSAGQKAELEHARDHDPRPYLRECAAALLMVADGYSAHYVALYCLHRARQPDTVYRWLDKYSRRGWAGLRHLPRGHRGFSPSRGGAVGGDRPPAP